MTTPMPTPLQEFAPSGSRIEKTPQGGAGADGNERDGRVEVRIRAPGGQWSKPVVWCAAGPRQDARQPIPTGQMATTAGVKRWRNHARIRMAAGHFLTANVSIKSLRNAQTKLCTGDGEQVTVLQGLLTADDTIGEAGLIVNQKEAETNAP